MADHNQPQVRHKNRQLGAKRRRAPGLIGALRRPGQALVEYTLILALVGLAIIAIIGVVGPAVGNIFSNQVVNLLGQTVTPYNTLSAADFWKYVTAVASYTPATIVVQLTQTAPPAPTVTNTIGPSPTASKTPTTTFTPSNTPNGPTATATDTNFGYPYHDNGDKPSQWNGDPTNPSTSAKLNSGTCSWGLETNLVHSPNSSYADSPRSGSTVNNYAVPSNCTYRLYGTIDLTSVGTDIPTLMFYDTYELSNSHTASVCLRDHATTASPLVCQAIHTGGSPITADLNWRYHTYALTGATKFGGVDWVGKKIEVSFQLNATAATGSADGWTIDDIAVDNGTLPTATFPIYDSGAVTPDSVPWVNECGWTIATTPEVGQPPTSSGNKNWASNPGKPYTKTTTSGNPTGSCPLMLNQIIDFSTVPTFTDPQLKFYSLADLDATGVATVEYCTVTPCNDSSAWTALTPRNGAGAVIAQGPTTPANPGPPGWTQIVVDLKIPSWQTTKFMLRFNFKATQDANPTTYPFGGWHLGEINIDNNNTPNVTLPFLEPFDQATFADHWITGGGWNNKFNDKFRNQYESWDVNQNSLESGNQHGVKSVVELNPNIDTTGATDPVLTFWSQWDVDDAKSTLSLEMSLDAGTTWTSLWKRNTTDPTFTHGTEKAWQRVAIDLGAAYTNKNTIRLHFIYDTSASTATNFGGWYIDDLSIVDKGSPTWDFTDVQPSLKDVRKLTNGPITDTIGTYATSGLNWYFGGSWRISSENTHQGATGSALNDSPSVNYDKPEDSVIQYRPAIDLTGIAKPALYFWTYFDVSNAAGNDKLYVDAAADTGTQDGELYTNTGVKPTWAQIWSNSSTDALLNTGWHLVAVDLSSLSGKVIHVRFRLSTNTATGTASQGWFIDDFAVIDRAQIGQLTLPYTFDSSATNFTTDFVGNTTAAPGADWLTEDTWAPLSTANTFTSWSYFNTFSTPLQWQESGWSSDWWHVDPATTAVWGSFAPGAINVTWPAAAAWKAGYLLFFNTDLGMDWSSNPALTNNPFNINAVFPPNPPTWGGAANNNAANTDYWLTRITRHIIYNGGGSNNTVQARLKITGGGRLKIGVNGATPTLVNPSSTSAGANADPFALSPVERNYYYTLNVNAGDVLTVVLEYYHTTLAQSGPAKADVQFATLGNVVRSEPLTMTTYNSGVRTSLQTAKYITIPANQSATVSFKRHWALGSNHTTNVAYSTDGGFTWTNVAALTQTGTQPDWLDQSFQIPGTASIQSQVMVRFELDSRIPGATADGVYIDAVSITTGSASAVALPSDASASIITTVSQTTVGPAIVNSAAAYTLAVNTSPDPNAGTLTVTNAGCPSTNQCFNFVPTPGYIGTTNFTFTATNSAGSTIGTGTIEVDPPNIGGSSPSYIAIQDYDFSPLGAIPNVRKQGYNVTYNVPNYANQGGAYRTNESVNLQTCGDSDTNGGANNMGWTSTGDWEKYTVNITQMGTYDIDFRLASTTGTGKIRLDLDGAPLATLNTVLNTGAFQTYNDNIITGVAINTLGRHYLTFNILTAGFNVHYIKFTLGTGAAPTSTPTFGPSPTPTTAPIVSPTPSITPIPPMLSGVVAAPSGDYNLTNLTSPSGDWAAWGVGGSSPWNQHQAGGTQISTNYTMLGGGTASQRTNDTMSTFTWTDGNPTASTSTTPNFVSTTGGVGTGFQFTVTADTTLRTLVVFVGVRNATGQLQATLSDGSAGPYTNATVDLVGTASVKMGMYTINYKAASAGQTLTIKWTISNDHSGASTARAYLAAAYTTP